MTEKAEKEKSNLIDFAEALRRKERAQQKAASVTDRPRFRFRLQKDGTVVLEAPFGLDYVFTEERLETWESYFRWYRKIFADRRFQVARVAGGKCSSLHCKRKQWRGTGACRSCTAFRIERARIQMQSERGTS